MITNNYQAQNIPYGAVKDIVPQQINEKLPQSVQNYDVQDSFNNNGAVKTVANKDTDPLTLGLTGGIWLAFAQLGQKLNNSLGKNWDESWLGKVGTFFDRFGKEPKAGKVTIKQHISNFMDKFAFTRALKTPTRAQNSLAVGQARGITGYVMSDVSSMLETALKNGQGDEILSVAKDIDPKVTLANGKEAFKYIKDLFDNFETSQPQIKKLIKNLSTKDVNISVDKLFGKIPNVPFLKRKGTFKELANKLNACVDSSVLSGAKTGLGKAMPKQVLKVYEGLTNAGAGGKLMIVMQAMIFAQAIKKAIDAPKGEKWATFSENIANDLGYFLSLPVQVLAQHKVGGLKYIGIGGAKTGLEQVKNVAQYRTMIKELNEKVANGVISKIDYTKEVKNIKQFLNGNSKWYHKPFKALGKLFSTGLNEETIKPFLDNKKSIGATVSNGIKKLGTMLKGKGGGALRLIIGMFVIGPMIGKAITKVSHMIFGRPTKSILDEEKEEQTQQNNQQTIAQDPNANLINQKYIQGTNQTLAQNTQIPQQGLNAMPSNQSQMELFGLGKKETPNIVQGENEPQRSYIPSSKPVVLQNVNEQGLDANVAAALNKAEMIEQEALSNL